ncbi:MAG: SDR family oxidoreductase [Bauldia sp.]|nr:SDR family oxidoreductase [Bauldia sp.]
MSTARAALADKAILVTGAATGIGRATAETLGAAGARVLGAGLDAAAGRELDAIAEANGWQLRFREADLTREADVRETVDAILDAYGRIDGVVNCAGIYTQGKRVEDVTDAEWDETLAVNLTAIFRICRATFPEMRKTGGGSVVNIASVHALATVPEVPAYAASKGGVLAFSRQLALDYAVDFIRVNALVVGSVNTRMTQAGLEAGGGAEKLGLSFDHNVIARIADPSEIARTVAFLLSDDASFITGSGLVVDGGMTARLF